MVAPPDDEHPMWCSRAALGRRQSGLAALDDAEVICRVALPAATMRGVISSGAPPEGMTRIAAWDPPAVLLADDPALAAMLRDAGIDVPLPSSTFAQRESDARNRLDAATHRFEDHGEVQHGSALDARVAIVVAWGAEPVRTLLAGVVREATSGVVIEARDPHNLRAFVLDAMDVGRVFLVRADATEEYRRGAGLDAALARLAGGG